MRRALLALLALTLLTPAAASAKGKDVGIGVLGGVVAPIGNRAPYEVSFAGAYFVDLPIYSAFHLAPYAQIYRLQPNEGKGQFLADAGMGFDFVVRTSPLKPLAGFTVGAATYGQSVRLDVGFQAGVYWKIVANLSLVFLGRYSIAIGDEDNLKRLQGMAGVMILL